MDRLRVLHAVARHGSISAAAGVLHVTTSAVSQQLAKLEREVGQVLTERSGRGIRLTDAGHLLAGHAGGLIAALDAAAADLAAHRGTVAGRVTIAFFASAVRGLGPDTLSLLRERHPLLTVRLAEQEPPESVPLTLRGEIDVAVVLDLPDAPFAVPEGLLREPLLDDVIDVALPATHPLAGAGTITLDQLPGEEWINWPDGGYCHAWLSRTLRRNGVEPRITHTANEYSSQLALVAAGFGVSVLPRLGRERIPAGVRLVALDPTPVRQLYAVWRADTAHRPAIGATVRALRDAAQRHCDAMATERPVAAA
ncbi:LysR family transcriptional regulator [Virgisporangium aliadipatigenens]|nr:LysR family transcriptional regulator [Virgisporangium aliadipatigenens]